MGGALACNVSTLPSGASEETGETFLLIITKPVVVEVEPQELTNVSHTAELHGIAVLSATARSTWITLATVSGCEGSMSKRAPDGASAL